MNKFNQLIAASALAVSSNSIDAKSLDSSNTGAEQTALAVQTVQKQAIATLATDIEKSQLGKVINQEKYVENQNNIETAESMIDFSELEKSSDVFSDVMFPNKDQLFTVSEDTPAELQSISDIRDLYSNILMSRSTDRSPAWDALFEKLEASEDKTLFIDFINKSVQNIKENHGDVEGIPTNVPQIYLEKSITASISALLNMPKEQTVIDGKVSEFTLRYLTDLTTALYLKGDIQESDIQVINNNGAYFATFAINEQTVSTLLDATQGKYSPLAVLQSMQTVGENLQEETVLLDGVPEDVLPDVEDQPIQNQKIFMKYFTENSSQFSGEELIDFGFDLADTLTLLQRVPQKTIEYAQDFSDTYGIDMQELIALAEKRKTILDNEDEIREEGILAAQQRLEKLNAEGRRLDAELLASHERTAEIDRKQKIVNELFAQLGKNN